MILTGALAQLDFSSCSYRAGKNAKSPTLLN
jgi:hypothetical protein